MIIGMRGHGFCRMEPAQLAENIASYRYRATQLAFGKAFPQSPETYMTEQALLDIRAAFEAQQIQIPVMTLSGLLRKSFRWASASTPEL